MPSIGLGVYRSPKGQITFDTVSTAINAGYRHIDTASVYGNEKDVGEAIKDSFVPRSEIFITTKLWNGEQGYDSTLYAFEKSINLLDVDYIDLYLIHFPVPKLRLESWKAMEELFKEGRIKAIGVSNFLPHHIQELIDNCNIPPMVNQIEAHPFQTQLPTRKICSDYGIVVSAYSPLVKAQKMNHPVLVQIAKQVGKTVAQVLIRWSIQNKMVPLPKSNTPSRILENSQVFDFLLSEEQIEQLNSLNQDLYTGWSPVGIP
ncbi:MAG: aldo/keto reductase [Proteobacteria bacterium]|nr:aldo/keto reductase [Pseudomonadota bacterium]